MAQYSTRRFRSHSTHRAVTPLSVTACSCLLSFGDLTDGKRPNLERQDSFLHLRLLVE